MVDVQIGVQGDGTDDAYFHDGSILGVGERLNVREVYIDPERGILDCGIEAVWGAVHLILQL